MVVKMETPNGEPTQQKTDEISIKLAFITDRLVLTKDGIEFSILMMSDIMKYRRVGYLQGVLFLINRSLEFLEDAKKTINNILKEVMENER